MAVEVPYNEDLALSPDGIVMEMPFYIGKNPEDLWLLPVEPTIAVRRGNVIARRQIAKPRLGFGSVKELWSTDDFEIKISGIFINQDSDELPIDIISRFKNLMDHPGPLSVYCSLFEQLGIDYIAVQDFELPPTEGIAQQEYTISALSDVDFELLSPIPF